MDARNADPKKLTNPSSRAKRAISAPIMQGLLHSGFAGVALFVFAACSTTEPPTNRVALADLGVRAAVEARATNFAPEELQSAREKLAKAKQAMTAENYEEERRLAESAQVDAELAQAKAESGDYAARRRPNFAQSRPSTEQSRARIEDTANGEP